MMLTQLLYISELSELPITDLDEFVAGVRERNKITGLSSILLCCEKFYIHFIEGRRIDVNNLYNKIRNDARHKNCTLLRYVDIKTREFDQWNAEYVRLSEFDIDGINLLLPVGQIDIETITSITAVILIRRIHAHLQIRAENALKTASKSA